MLETYVIHVTKECNMNCFYCYEKDKSSKYTLDEVVAFADNVAKNCKEDNFIIEFLGGEPLLAFDIVRAVYEFIESKYPNRVPTYVITTNGSILTEEIKQFLLKHSNVIYAVSEDGTKWANQFRRFKDGTNTFDVVIKNIKWAVENIPNQTNVHMVTHLYNVGNIFNSVKYLYDIGVRSIGMGTVESTMRIDSAYCNRFIKEMLLVSESIANGTFKDLTIDILHHIKPKEDVRTYIKDPATGKTIGESYGRIKDDVTDIDDYNSVRTSSPFEDMIYGIRHCAYINHQEMLKQYGESYDNI